MFIPWKLYSFWLTVIAWICAVSGVFTFFLTVSDSFGIAFAYLIGGGVAFVFWQTLSLFAKVAEHYLSSKQDLTSDGSYSD